MRHPERISKKHVQKRKSVRMCFSKPEEDERMGTEADGVNKPPQSASELANEKTPGSPQTQRFEDVVCQLAQLCLVHVNERSSEQHLVFLSLLLRRNLYALCLLETRKCGSIPPNATGIPAALSPLLQWRPDPIMLFSSRLPQPQLFSCRLSRVFRCSAPRQLFMLLP